MTIGAVPAPTGGITVIHRSPSRLEQAARRGLLIPNEEQGHVWADRAHLTHANRAGRSGPWQQRMLAWLRDHVSPDFPRAYYRTVLGHDAHMSLWAELYVRHFHATEKDPFTGQHGWWENVGLVSQGKVTTAFRDFLALMLVTDATTMGDYKYHEVGTDNTAEANSQTALIVSTGIARVSGTQTNPTASTYESVATVTADSTETWQEHGLFNASSGVTLLDRSLISPTVAVVPSDQVQFTYTLTLNAEA